jgi:Leucine-rich repeat (LRR) protein
MFEVCFLLVYLVTLSTACQNFTFEYSVFIDGNPRQVATAKNATLVTASETKSRIIIKNQYITKLCNSMFNLSQKIDKISINNCEVAAIEKDFLRDEELNEIEIVYNKMLVIGKHTFRHVNVINITLSENGIKTLEDEAFFDLANLCGIDLSSNFLAFLNPNAFALLPKIRYLGLRDNGIKILYAQNFRFFSEEEANIWLSFNEITDIDKVVFDGLLSRNISLDLRNNKLNALPAGVFDNHNFSDINLWGNEITDISADFCGQNCNIGALYLNVKSLTRKSLMNLKKWANNSTKSYILSASSRFFVYFVALIKVIVVFL